ncbi:MAG: methyltransferase domain-containing protein [Myxococcales bacterium]|nr:methyltransferase domain-containing protein [Myxococcales bacterium]
MDDKADEDAEDVVEKRVATDGVPLAAIFKTRRGGRKRGAASGDRSVAEANARRAPAEEPSVIEVLDALVIEESPLMDAAFALGEPVLDEPDDGFVAVPAELRAPPAPEPEEEADDTVDMDGALEEDIPLELLSTADDLTPLRNLLPPDADLAWAQDALLALAAQDAARLRTPARGAWFSELFSEEYLSSQPIRSDAAVEREVEFLEATLGLVPGARILDLACGAGRHAAALARRGYDVVAIDLSLPLLRRGVDVARQEDLPIHFIHGDMRDLDFEDEFDAICLLDTSFGYFTDVENLMVLRSLHRALRPGGRLLLDVANRDFIQSAVPTRNWWEGEGCLVQEDIELALGTSRLEIRRYLVFADGRERIYDISIRLFAVHELRHLAQLVGLEILEVSGSVHTAGAFFGCGSERIMLTARRGAGRTMKR